MTTSADVFWALAHLSFLDIEYVKHLEDVSEVSNLMSDLDTFRTFLDHSEMQLICGFNDTFGNAYPPVIVA